MQATRGKAFPGRHISATVGGVPPPTMIPVSVAPQGRVLIADDDERLLHIMRLFLESQGYAVETAANGEEAIAAALRETPALVILDIMMPGIDGLAACRHLRRQEATRHLPILIYSAMTTAEPQGASAGADEIIAKPFNLPFLARAVHDHIDRVWGEGTADRIRRPQQDVAPFPAGSAKQAPAQQTADGLTFEVAPRLAG